jgi:hypothetical protein
LPIDNLSNKKSKSEMVKTLHSNIALRFIQFAWAMETLLEGNYITTNILNNWLSSLPRARKVTSFNNVHDCIIGDTRRQLPQPVFKGIKAWISDNTLTSYDNEESIVPTIWGDDITDYRNLKVEVKRVTCFLNGNYPDMRQNDWEKFDCSHLCIDSSCVFDSSHYCWEPKSINQSRGYGLCRKICNHLNCNRPLCIDQNLHYPNCL